MLDAGTLIAILGPHAKKLLEDRVKEYLKKPHGSKVKEGAFEDCTIELDEDTDMAYIAVNPSRGEVIYLTSNTIRSVQFEKEDLKWSKGKLKTYYIDSEVLPLKLKKLIHHINPPCAKCPYKLGLVHTVVNPCPQCKESGYQTFERFQKQALGDSSTSEHGKR